MDDYRLFNLVQRRCIGRYPTPEKMMSALAQLVTRDPSARKRVAAMQVDKHGQLVGSIVSAMSLDLFQWTT
jgi:hypothetical protein